MVIATASMHAALLVQPLVSLNAASFSGRSAEDTQREAPRLVDRYDAARVSPVYLIPGAATSHDAPTKELSAMAELLQGGRAVESTPTEEVNGADILDRLSQETREQVESALAEATSADYFSSQNTADRIVSFVIGGFRSFEGGAASRENSAEARQRFVDFIRPAIDKGYAQALEMLGPLDDRISSELAETRTLIGDGLDAFAKSEPIDAVA